MITAVSKGTTTRVPRCSALAASRSDVHRASPGRPAVSGCCGMLTDAEHKAMKLTADLWDHLCSAVVRGGDIRNGDLNELAMHVHAIQHAVMAQAAARAYPALYRPLGGSLR
jgi:hypothetical protein